MSVIVTVVIPVDTDQFRSWLENDIETISAISQKGRDGGAIHHQFAVGDGEALVVDEWTSAEAFQEFFSSPEIAEAMANGGAQGPPVVSIYEALDADRF